jgi:hypothetical protein
MATEMRKGTGIASNARLSSLLLENAARKCSLVHINRGIARVGRVAWLPRAADPKGREMNIVNERFDFLCSTDFNY